MARWFWTLALSIVACGEADDTARLAEASTCRPVLHPQTVSFGITHPGRRIRHGLVLLNEGARACVVTEVQADFPLGAEPSLPIEPGRVILPSERTGFGSAFTAAVNRSSGAWIITFEAPAAPESVRFAVRW